MRYAVLFIICCLTSVRGYSQSLVAFRDSVKNGYNFWLYLPEGCDTVNRVGSNRGKPLVIFLHGNSLCGNDLYQVRKYGCIDAVEKGVQIDAFILAPQNRGGAWNPSKILTLLDWVQKRYPIDTDRVYVTGMSLGGYGTVDFAGTYPERVAAAAALCGGGTLSSFSKLAQVPLWMVHGTADIAVPVSQSQRVADAVKQCGDTTLLRFDKLPGVNHAKLARTFYLPVLYQWLFAHSLNDSVRHINRDCAITSGMLTGAFRNPNKNAKKFTVIDPAR